MKSYILSCLKSSQRQSNIFTQLQLRKIASVPESHNPSENIEHVSSLGTGELTNQENTAKNTDTSAGKGHPYKSLFPWKSKKELSQFLSENVIYSKDGIIAINKPFGVGVLNIEEQKAKSKTQAFVKNDINRLHIRGIGESPYTLQHCLPFLKTDLDTPDLQLIKSTGKYTSGIALFATNEKYAEMCRHSLKATKPYPFYNFSILSVNIPDLPGGKLEERVGLKQQAHPLTDVKQPLIVRQFSRNAMKRRDVRPVNVSICLKSRSRPNVALLQLKTSSVKWNFVQIYCADMLAPILGDHLFSSRVQSMMGVPTRIHPVHLVPGSTHQKLSKSLWETLQLTNETDSLIVPTHIHLSSLTLRHYDQSHNTVVIHAPLCPYFQWTCDTLSLTIPPVDM